VLLEPSPLPRRDAAASPSLRPVTAVFRWVDHTAELELEIEATTEEAVFADALAAMAELLSSERDGRPDDEGSVVHRHVSVTADDRPALLAAWMEELVFLAEDEGIEPLDVESFELGPRFAKATVVGRLGQPRPVVKAVTYHRLSLAPTGVGYRATVVLDV
jgi:SHS2 domain-containing protein